MANLYRKIITADNTGGAAQTDYQVCATFDTNTLIGAGKMQADCDDIRLYLSSDRTPLLHSIQPESKNTAATKIWAEVPTLGTGAPVLIDMEYGDLTLTNIETLNTFLFGDYFDGGSAGNQLDTGKWPYQRGTWQYVDDTGNGGTGLSAKYVSGGSARYRAISDVSLGALATNFRAIYRSRANSDVDAQYPGVMFSNSSDIAAVAGYGYSGSFTAPAMVYEHSGATGAVLVTDLAQKGLTTYHNCEFWKIGTTYYFSRPTVFSINATDATYSTWYPALISFGGVVFFDWMFVVKAQTTEPTVSVGAETELGPIIDTVTPDRGYQGETKAITIAGANFAAGATVTLTEAGESDIDATSVVVNSSEEIECDIPIGAAEKLGWWDMTITNP